MKIDKPGIEAMRDAMRKATQLVGTRGPMAATRLIQRLLGSHQATPATPTAFTPNNARFETAPDVEVLDPIPAHVPRAEKPESIPAHVPHIDEVPAVLPGESGEFLAKRFSSALGDRNFKLYVPSCYAGTPLPLVIMLHGCTQDPDDFAIGTRANRWAESRQCLIAYPEQVQRANLHRCWNWFRPADQHAGRGEPAIIAGITKQILDEYQIDARRVYVAGLSAGGAMAAIMGHAYPDLFAAIGVHSGLPVAAAHDVPSALALMKTGRSPLTQRTLFQPAGNPQTNTDGRVVPMIVLHGDADRTVNPVNATRLVDDAIEARRSLSVDSPLQSRVQTVDATLDSHGYRRTEYFDANGLSIIEHWEIRGAGHAWAGGNAAGSYTEARGPDSTRTMLKFFAQHRAPNARTVPDVIDSAVPM